MDSITRLASKLTVERSNQQRQQPQPAPAPPPEGAPPPYTPNDSDSEGDDEDSDDESSMPVKLTINAANQIRGSNNLVPTSPSPLADATKFSTLLLHAVNQINGANAASSNSTAHRPGPRRQRRNLKVDLTINCGITVVGDRNVIGNVGLKPRAGAVTAAAAAGGIVVGNPASATTTITPPLTPPAVTAAGAKRKAEDGPVCEAEEGEPASKRVEVSIDDGE